MPLNSHASQPPLNSHMFTMAKNAPPSEVTHGLESDLRHHALISSAASADADALIITPAAAPAAVFAASISIASPVSPHLFSHFRN